MMITQILKNGLDIEIPEFKPFSEKLTLYFLNQKQTESFNKPLAKDLASKLIKKLMNDGKLKSDYKTKLEIIENELNDFGDNLLKDYVLNRINKVIEIYQKTGVWDFLLLGK
ncbi:hypothetical protein [Paenibacillus pini]|uniref:Uncharacterized protein n=1 Tax=Paenibacillus pini JCM 16418 TaxID=1236976 RepID=W7YIY6_9BACL|nr:hypothetical protein [Paenibacillus pini]GAF10865.1 hypothetical protein JCM16418_5093 [Paenibacillus pini JCM 16418]